MVFHSRPSVVFALTDPHRPTRAYCKNVKKGSKGIERKKNTENKYPCPPGEKVLQEKEATGNNLNGEKNQKDKNGYERRCVPCMETKLHWAAKLQPQPVG